jgi:hypothetical protein
MVTVVGQAMLGSGCQDLRFFPRSSLRRRSNHLRNHGTGAANTLSWACHGASGERLEIGGRLDPAGSHGERIFGSMEFSVLFVPGDLFNVYSWICRFSVNSRFKQTKSSAFRRADARLSWGVSASASL